MDAQHACSRVLATPSVDTAAQAQRRDVSDVLRQRDGQHDEVVFAESVATLECTRRRRPRTGGLLQPRAVPLLVVAWNQTLQCRLCVWILDGLLNSQIGDLPLTAVVKRLYHRM
jgi:hypothetical protein